MLRDRVQKVQKVQRGKGCGCAAGCVKGLCSLRSGGDSRLQRLRVVVSPLEPLCGSGSEGSEGSKGSEGVVSPLRGDEFYNSASRNEKPYNRAAPVGNAPLLPTAPPPEGEVLAALCLKMLMGPKAERRAKFPLRGKGGALAPKGVHFRERSEVCLFSSGRSPVVWFSLRYCHKLKLTSLPSIHSPTTKWAGRWCRKPPKGALPQAAFYTGARRAPTSPAQRFYITPL